jgi:hypothetical protein
MKLSELIDQLEDLKTAAAMVGDADPRLFFLVDRDDKRQILVTNMYLAYDHAEQRTRLIFW